MYGREVGLLKRRLVGMWRRGKVHRQGLCVKVSLELTSSGAGTNAYIVILSRCRISMVKGSNTSHSSTPLMYISSVSYELNPLAPRESIFADQ